MEFMDYGILYTYTVYENKKMDAPFGFKTKTLKFTFFLMATTGHIL